MTDDLDPSRLLASAALDNEVDADDRARVEASPELRQEMEQYRTIAAEMRSVEVLASSRESAVAAALAVFDELANDRPVVATGAVTPPASLASMRARRRQLWLGRIGSGLAAAAVVAVVGIAALRSGSGEDKKSATTVAVVDQASGAVPASAAKSQSADASLSTPSAQAPNVAGSSSAATATTAAAAETVPVDPWVGAPSFTNPEELLAYAGARPGPSSTAAATAASTAVPAGGGVADTTAGTTAGTATPAPVTLAACAAPAGGSLVPVFYGGQRAYLERDDAAGLLRVLNPDNCAEIFSVPLG